ncbi:hypothetical protein ACVWZ4_007492 [Bradyrhizobium sp. USDA 4472]
MANPNQQIFTSTRCSNPPAGLTNVSAQASNFWKCGSVCHLRGGRPLGPSSFFDPEKPPGWGRCGLLPSCLQAHGPPVQLEGTDYSSLPMAGWLRLFTLIQCFCRRPRYARSRCLETNPSRPKRQAARNKSGPIAPRSKGATVMRSGRRAKSLARLVAGARANAHIIAVYGENVEGIKLHLMLVLAGVQRVEIGNAVTTASPSMTNCFCRLFGGASAIKG